MGRNSAGGPTGSEEEAASRVPARGVGHQVHPHPAGACAAASGGARPRVRPGLEISTATTSCGSGPPGEL